MSAPSFKSIKELVTQGIQRHPKCEGCGKDFTCGVGLSGCWCAKIELSEEARQELRSRFSDCLCLECLKEFERADK